MEFIPTINCQNEKTQEIRIFTFKNSKKQEMINKFLYAPYLSCGYFHACPLVYYKKM